MDKSTYRAAGRGPLARYFHNWRALIYAIRRRLELPVDDRLQAIRVDRFGDDLRVALPLGRTATERPVTEGYQLFVAADPDAPTVESKINQFDKHLAQVFTVFDEQHALGWSRIQARVLRECDTFTARSSVSM